MKLREWYDFNFNNGQFTSNIGDFYVKVFKDNNTQAKNKVLDTLMSANDMLYLFEDYKLIHMGKNTQNEYCTWMVCVYKES